MHAYALTKIIKKRGLSQVLGSKCSLLFNNFLFCRISLNHDELGHFGQSLELLELQVVWNQIIVFRSY